MASAKLLNSWFLYFFIGNFRPKNWL